MEELISEEIVDHALAVRVMFELSELLINELKAYGKQEVFYEVKELIHRLDEEAYQQKSHSLMIDTSILQAKLAMVEGDLDKSQQFLDQGEQIIKEKAIPQLTNKVLKEKEELNYQYETWEFLIQSNAPFKSRLEQAHIAEYINVAKKVKREWEI